MHYIIIICKDNLNLVYFCKFNENKLSENGLQEFLYTFKLLDLVNHEVKLKIFILRSVYTYSTSDTDFFL